MSCTHTFHIHSYTMTQGEALKEWELQNFVTKENKVYSEVQIQTTDFANNFNGNENEKM